MLIDAPRSQLLIIDVQARLVPAIADHESVVAGVRVTTLLANIRPQDTRQCATAQQVPQLAGLALARA